MLGESGTVVMNRYGQNQRRVKMLSETFSPLTSEEEEEPVATPTRVPVLPRPPRKRAVEIDGFSCPLPPRASSDGV